MECKKINNENSFSENHYYPIKNKKIVINKKELSTCKI